MQSLLDDALGKVAIDESGLDILYDELISVRQQLTGLEADLKSSEVSSSLLRKSKDAELEKLSKEFISIKAILDSQTASLTDKNKMIDQLTIDYKAALAELEKSEKLRSAATSDCSMSQEEVAKMESELKELREKVICFLIFICNFHD